MGRNKHKLGRWASGSLRLDILQELKILAIKESTAEKPVTMAQMVNRALWLGLVEIRRHGFQGVEDVPAELVVDPTMIDVREPECPTGQHSGTAALICGCQKAS